MPRLWLAVEFLLLFVALPLGFRYLPLRLPALPVLWAAAIYAAWMLRHTAGFERAALWNPAPFAAALPRIFAVFVPCALLMWLAVHRLAPQLEWSFVRQRPGLWLLVMVLYPVLSVYPQSLLYRAFFVERYGVFFPNQWSMILASAAAFGFMHLVFRNWLAVGLTFAGGLLFTARYLETGSLMTSAFEHALYGCWLFTVGLGQYFYHGRFRLPTQS